MKKTHKLSLLVLIIFSFSNCSDFLNPTVQQSKPIKEETKSVQGLKNLMNGAYRKMISVEFLGGNYLLNGEVRSDNAWSNGKSGRFIDESRMNYTAGLNKTNHYSWEYAYPVLPLVNTVISADIPTNPEVKYVKGEAHGIRALVEMYMLLAYGEVYVDGDDRGVPYVTKVDATESPGRGTVKETWEKIGEDFQKAIDLMDPSLDGPSITLTYYGVRALQARYYLFRDMYQKAASAAIDVIKQGGYKVIPASDLVKTWASHDEASNNIFELEVTASNNIDGKSNDISMYQMVNKTSYGDIEATQDLYNLYKSDDPRQNLFTFSELDGNKEIQLDGKYSKNDASDNMIIIRYAEVILTAAEAEARMGNTGEAQKYLNMIIEKRNEGDIPATIKNIMTERRKELAFEGLRFYDLLRTGQDIVRKKEPDIGLNYSIDVPYGSHLLAWPLPRNELDANSNLKQNKGY